MYSLAFSLAAGVAMTGTYLVAPSREIKANDSQITSNDNITSSEESEDEDIFIPEKMTPRDYLIDNLSQMKVLSGQADLSLSIGEYNIALNISNLYLTLETLSDIELNLAATLSVNDVSCSIEASFVNNVIYLSFNDNDIKLETSSFSEIITMIQSFGLPEISLPSFITDINFDTLQNNLGTMPYYETESGYRYDFTLFEGLTINFESDKDYNLTSVKVDNAQVEGINLSLNSTLATDYVLEEYVAIPETSERKFMEFNNLLPLMNQISKLVNKTQFGLSLSGEVILDNSNSLTISGLTHFDVASKEAKACLDIVEHYHDELFTHQLALDLNKEDVYFRYNDVLKARLAFNNVSTLVDTFSTLMNKNSEGVGALTSGLTSFISGSILEQILNGKYELLLNNVIDNFVLEDGHISLTVKKELLNLDSDINLSLTFDGEDLLSVDISNLSLLGKNISLSASLINYDSTFDVDINRVNQDEYSDLALLSPIVESIKNLMSQKQFALSLSGSLRKENQQTGLTFSGYTQFDLSNDSGDGEITIVENESEFETKPTHNLKVGVDQKDVRLVYNDSLKGRFTIQTIKDMFGIVDKLLTDQNSRIYQWFGEQLENMSSSILSRVINGEYALLLHNIFKSISISSTGVNIVVNGSLFDIASDINVQVGLSEGNITSLQIVDLSSFGYTINLDVTLNEFNNDYQKLPSYLEDTYYDFSDIKLLADLGLNVADLDYFHLNGTVLMNMEFIGISLDKLAGIKDMPLDAHIYENNGNVCIYAKIENIPCVGPINGVNWFDYNKKTLEVYYDSGYIYMTRTENKGKNISYVRTEINDFTAHIFEYLLGWGMGLQRNSTIWNSLNGAVTTTNPRTQAMNYANILTNYQYSYLANNEYGNYCWDLGINVAEIANNTDLKNLTATIYGREGAYVNPTTNETVYMNFLSHLDAAFAVSTSGFSMDLSASINLIDVNPFLTYNDFLTNELTAAGFTNFKNHVASRINDSPLTF